jgi:hypothetical protein
MAKKKIISEENEDGDDIEPALMLDVRSLVDGKLPVVMSTAFKDYYVLLESEQAKTIIEGICQAFGWKVTGL